MAKTIAKRIQWYNQRLVALGLAVASFGLSYIFGLHALGTANMWQYTATFVLLIVAINRLVKGIRG